MYKLRKKYDWSWRRCLSFWTKQNKIDDTLWAENRTYGNSPADTEFSVPSEICCCNSADPFERLGGEDIGKNEPEENATGWGDAGEERKGTAAGRTGEVKTGGPGGVLKWGMGLPLLTPLAGDGTFELSIEDGLWSCCNFGRGNLGGVGEIEGGGGIGLFSVGGFDGVILTAYPREGCGGLAILNSNFSVSKKKKYSRGPRIKNGTVQKLQRIQSQTESYKGDRQKALWDRRQIQFVHIISIKKWQRNKFAKYWYTNLK
jgi:hypothetical protein